MVPGLPVQSLTLPTHQRMTGHEILRNLIRLRDRLSSRGAPRARCSSSVFTCLHSFDVIRTVCQRRPWTPGHRSTPLLANFTSLDALSGYAMMRHARMTSFQNFAIRDREVAFPSYAPGRPVATHGQEHRHLHPDIWNRHYGR